MEHITIIQLGNGMVRLVPDNGYRLFDTRTGKYHPRADVKETNVRFFVAEAKTE